MRAGQEDGGFLLPLERLTCDPHRNNMRKSRWSISSPLFLLCCWIRDGSRLRINFLVAVLLLRFKAMRNRKKAAECRHGLLSAYRYRCRLKIYAEWPVKYSISTDISGILITFQNHQNISSTQFERLSRFLIVIGHYHFWLYFTTILQ